MFSIDSFDAIKFMSDYFLPKSKNDNFNDQKQKTKMIWNIFSKIVFAQKHTGAKSDDLPYSRSWYPHLSTKNFIKNDKRANYNHSNITPP